MRNKGFTLLEMLIVVIVIAVLATIAVPQFVNVAERGRESKARTNVNIIAETERRLESESGAFTAASTDAACLATFGVDSASDPDWTYRVTVDNTVSPRLFTITATRNGGTNNNETLILGSSGDWSTGTWVL